MKLLQKDIVDKSEKIRMYLHRIHIEIPMYSLFLSIFIKMPCYSLTAWLNG